MKKEIIAFNPGFRFKPGLSIPALEMDVIEENRKVLIDSGSVFVCSRDGIPVPVGAIINQRTTLNQTP